MNLNKSQIKRFLPHRDPFLFIDEVISVELPEHLNEKKAPFSPQQLIGTKIHACYLVESSMKILEGHFPGSPILPGVVQIEMMAQASSFIVVYCLDKPIEEVRLEVALLAVDGARFRKPIIPPMLLDIKTTLLKVRGSSMLYRAQIFHQDMLMSETNLLATLKII